MIIDRELKNQYWSKLDVDKKTPRVLYCRRGIIFVTKKIPH